MRKRYFTVKAIFGDGSEFYDIFDIGSDALEKAGTLVTCCSELETLIVNMIDNGKLINIMTGKFTHEK